MRSKYCLKPTMILAKFGPLVADKFPFEKTMLTTQTNSSKTLEQTTLSFVGVLVALR